MVDLRAFIYLDSLQPQFASFQATISKGYLPKVGQASLFVEIAPGMAINQILDVALKSTESRFINSEEAMSSPNHRGLFPARGF